VENEEVNVITGHEWNTGLPRSCIPIMMSLAKLSFDESMQSMTQTNAWCFYDFFRVKTSLLFWILCTLTVKTRRPIVVYMYPREKKLNIVHAFLDFFFLV